jgi:predicted flap endonuclease-1-like 5' DNA nuclease
MITLISQMVGCLLVAAGIGAAVGWLLRHPSRSSIEQQCQDLTNLLRTKEQTLETTSHDLKVKTSAMQILEQKIMSSEALSSSVQRELTARGERVKALEAELALRSKRLTDVEAEGAAARRRVSEVESIVAAQAEELRGAQQACRTTEQAREVLEQEIRVLRDHIAQLNEGLADRDQLRIRLEKLESAQDRVHQLEVELSDREATHRGTIQQLERTVAERDRRIDELVAVTHLLREKEMDLKEWEKKYRRTVHEHEVETTKLQDQCAAQDQLRAQHLLDAQQLQERDEQIANLQRQLDALQAERQDLLKAVESIPGKDEHIDRLRKRLRDMRVTLRDKAAHTSAGPRQTHQNRVESSARAGLSKIGKEVQEDDLKKIHGIGPVFAQTLKKLGTHTFIQIARWKPDEIEKIAKKLDADPERIKRDNWIADAKKQHYRKYRERL